MFMEDLGIFDDDIDIDYSDPRWLTPLGMEVLSFLVRQRLAPLVFLFFSLSFPAT
jgi:hypothetical protein